MNTAQTHLNTGVFGLISDSGPVALVVLFLLFMASIFCWAIIITKWKLLKSAMRQDARFLDTFWQGKNMDEILAKADQFPGSPIMSVFKSGVRELKKLTTGGELPHGSSQANEGVVGNIQRALVKASQSEIARLESSVGWLATTASAAPFVGLFGTVWGIMNAFQNIGATGAANLAVVAPGISEALITTATGIAAAIPAVIAYNHFGNQIRRLAVEMEGFSQDFLNIVQRSALANRRGSS